jgi:hypothetical protein
LLALTVALVPGFADVMTAVNSDAAAVAALSLFLWSAARAIRRGAAREPTGWALAGCTLAAALCPLAKNTAAVALLLLPVVWALTLAPRRAPGPRSRPRTQLYRALAGLLAAALSVILVFSWGNAAHWFRFGEQRTPTRQIVQPSPLGETSLVLEQEVGQLRQILPEKEVAALRGAPVTLGAWVWSTQPLEVVAPDLVGDRAGDDLAPPLRGTIEVGVEPGFYAFTSTIPSEAAYLYVDLYSAPSGLADPPPVYYDGVVLAEGERTTAAGLQGSRVPLFDGRTAATGVWAERRFENRVRNGSADAAAPYVRPWLEQTVEHYARRSPTRLLNSLLDWERSAALYPIVARSLFETFWARFGWNHIPLPGAWYGLLAMGSLFCVVGAIVGVVRMWRTQRAGPGRRRALFLLGLSGALVWGNAALRVHPLGIKAFVPVARYAYPAILPTALALVGGALALTRRRLRALRRIMLACLAALALISLLTLIATHDYRRLPPGAGLVALALAVCVAWGAGRTSAGERRAALWARQAGRAIQAWRLKHVHKQPARTLALALILVLLAVVTARSGRAATETSMLGQWSDAQDVRTRAVDALNALVQEWDLSGATVGIASELHFHPLQLRQIDTELLYRARPAAELVCQPAAHDILVLPLNDGTPLTAQAVEALTRKDVPHVAVLARGASPWHAQVGVQNILIAAARTRASPPQACHAPPGGSEEKAPAPLAIGDWEAPIPDRLRPDESLPRPWEAAPVCPDVLPVRIVEDQVARYSRLQAHGLKMQITLRGRLRTEPCKLSPGFYSMRWRARSERPMSHPALLAVSVWEHPPGREARVVHSRLVQTGPDWTDRTEWLRVTRGIPLSLEIRWLDGPGYPDLEEGEPRTALSLAPQVWLQETDPPLGQALATNWRDTLYRLVGRGT